MGKPNFVKFIKGNRPKRFHLPTIQMILLYPPTPRHILWVIANDPSAFNFRYFGQFAAKNPKLAERDSPLGKALDMLGSLKVQHFVKELPNGDWRITIKGQLYRLTTHPQWIFVQLFLGAALAFIVGYS